MNRHGPPTRRARRAFTLIELLVSIAIIALLLGILSVALSDARSSARSAAENQLLQGLAAGIASFSNDHRFIPPMVKDNSRDKYKDGWDNNVFDKAALRAGFDFGGRSGDPGPLLERGDERNWVNVFSFSRAVSNSESNDGDREYLRGEGIGLMPDNDTYADGDYRFSEYSMPYYILGVLPEPVDYEDGPGIRGPSRSGSFSPGVAATGPYFDVGEDAQSLVAVDPENGRYELRTPNGVAIRYYRWMPGMPNPSGNTPDYLENDADNYRTYDVIRGSDEGGADDLNIPWVVGLKAKPGFNSNYTEYTSVGTARYRDATWALVTAGDDGVFGDYGSETAESILERAGEDPTTNDKTKRARAALRAAEDNGIVIGNDKR